MMEKHESGDARFDKLSAAWQGAKRWRDTRPEAGFVGSLRRDFQFYILINQPSHVSQIVSSESNT